MVLTDFLTGIADAIRQKYGTDDKIEANNFRQLILDIPSGGSSELSSNIKTGTFTVAEDTTDVITIPHGLGRTPFLVFIFPDNPEYAIDNIAYSFMGGVNNGSTKLCTANTKVLTEKYNLATIEVDDTNIVITISSTTYRIIAGLVYRWFVWGASV